MKVLKFGGTSVGSAQRIKEVAKLVTERGHNIVVLSAMSGTTNTLVEIAKCIYSRNIAEAEKIICSLQNKYADTINELYDTNSDKSKATEAVGKSFETLRSYLCEDLTLAKEKVILAQGELMSTAMMNIYLLSKGVKSVLIPALDFMKTNENGEPDNDYIALHIAEKLKECADAQIIITQGFICHNSFGEIDNLQRGGSDYTASLIGAAIKAEEIEIWTDIDGMHNNDPRYVENTRPVRYLHFEEAAELAYFGAKILHPTCILPAKMNNIPVRLLNTMQPDAEGTLIYNRESDRTIKAVAAKDNIISIKIKSGRMLLAYGFLRKVFEVFETYKTPIDMITTSEVGVSLTIDDEKNLPMILSELQKYGTVTVDKDMAIICVVGDLEWQNRGFESKTLEAFKDIPVRMISYGGSNYNISFLIRQSDKVKALKALSDKLFN